MAPEEEKKQGDSKGFAGLSSMVSDVGDTVACTSTQAQTKASASSTQQSLQANNLAQHEQPESTSETYQAPDQLSGDSSAVKWLPRIVAVLSVIAIIFPLWGFINYISSTPAPPPRSSAASVGPAPSSTPTQALLPPALGSLGTSRPAADKPSVGRNNVLTTAQIRYCLAEKIRLDAAESVINNFIDSDVIRYNGYVNDYNSRCGEFRYRQGALESARRDVEPYRSQLQAEGRGRFVRSPSSATRSLTPAQKPQPVRPSPDATVQAIQRRLNELGYDAGTADGLFGNKTRVAILAFQRDSGQPADGLPTENLQRQLRQVNSINERATGAPTSPPATSRTPQPASAPTNFASGKPSLSAVSPPEQASIENACGYDKQYRSAGDYYTCLRRELAKLGEHSGKPDLSRASSSEQASIENACNYDRQYRGPGDYYSCLKREMAKLSSQSGRPDLSRASSSEQASIENACNYDRQYRGPGDYYSCLRRELSKLGNR